MATILFATWDGGGNVPPLLGIAAELQRRGHDVRVMGHAGQASTVETAGLPFRTYPTARAFSSTEPSSPGTLLGVFGDRAMGRDVVEELTSRPADIVVVDCLLFGVMEALSRARHSYVVLEHSFDGYFRRAARGPLGLLLRLRGFRPLRLIDAGSAVLAATLPELDTGHGNVTHTGPVLPAVPAPAGPLPETPTVLISLSTFAFRSLGATWQRVLDAVDGLPGRVIATTGPSVDAASLRVPANVELHAWLPHAEVLPQVSLVVSHGGHSTAMIALAHGSPLLLLPLDPKSDQPFVGRTIQRAGAGRTLSRRSSPRRIRAAIEELLGDGPHRSAAARLGAEIRSLDGSAVAADRIERLVEEVVRHP